MVKENIISFQKALSEKGKNNIDSSDIFEIIIKDMVDLYLTKYSHIDPNLFVIALNTQSINFLLAINPDLMSFVYKKEDTT